MASDLLNVCLHFYRVANPNIIVSRFGFLREGHRRVVGVVIVWGLYCPYLLKLYGFTCLCSANFKIYCQNGKFHKFCRHGAGLLTQNVLLAIKTVIPNLIYY